MKRKPHRYRDWIWQSYQGQHVTWFFKSALRYLKRSYLECIVCLHALTKGVGGEISLSLEDDYAKHCLSGAIVICCQHRDLFCVSRGFRSATLTPLQFQICLSQLLALIGLGCSLVYRSLTSCGSIRGGHLSTTTTLSWGMEHHGFETFSGA